MLPTTAALLEIPLTCPGRLINRYEITTRTIVEVRECQLTPQPPVILSNMVSLTFTPTPTETNMAQRTITIQLGGVVDPTVTSIPITVTGSTAPGMNPVVVDAFNPAASFLANDGDILMETGVQINPTGSSPASVPLEFVVAPGIILPGPPKGVLPVAPVIASNTAV